MKPSAPQPVELIVGVLYSDEMLFERARDMLQQKYGKIDFQSQKFEFTFTDYYCDEMGSPIYRLFISFQQLIHPKEIARIKTETNAIEEQLAVDGKRKVNLDPGYLDFDKLVLASAKYNGQKIYLDFGIWADLTLYYRKGNFYPYPWSFPDFKSGIYNRCFLRIRELYKAQSKKFRLGAEKLKGDVSSEIEYCN